MTTPTKQVVQWGNSLGVRIPKDAAARAGIAKGSSVRIVSEPGKLVLFTLSPEETRIPQYSLKNLLRDVTPQKHRDIEWLDATPVGKEEI